MRILAVDDDFVARSLLKQALALAGYSDVMVAGSAADALYQINIAEAPFECFLFDIQMEGMDGIELCRNVRALPDYAETPIIMVTSMQEKSYVDAAFAAGATDYVTKPFDMLELGTRVRIAENISEKLKRIGSKDAEISTLAKLANLATTHQTEMRISDVNPCFSEFPEFEQRLRSIPRSTLAGLSVVTWRIVNFGRLTRNFSDAEKKSLIADVASSFGETLDGPRYLAAYYGKGVFVGVFADEHLRKSTESIQHALDRRRRAAASGDEPVLLEFGEWVHFSQPALDDPLALVWLEIRNAIARQDQSNVKTPLAAGAPRPALGQSGLEETIRAMKPHYLTTLNEALGKLDIASQKLAQGSVDAENLQMIGRVCHKIAGVAPMLGFEDLGVSAAATESEASRLLALPAGSADLGKLAAQLNDVLDKIEDELVEGFGQ